MLAPLGMPDDHVAAAQLGEHGAADVAGVGAAVVLREILGAVADEQPVAVDQRLDAPQIDERRQHDDLDGGEVLLLEAERDLLGECDRLEVVQVHLPVAGDERLTGQGQLSSSTATPGRVLPSRYSSEAPPPVEMCPNACAGRRSLRTAAAESPPPTTVSPGAAATASATPLVPAANGATSKTPIGPFQNTVRAWASSAANALTVCGPMSRPFVPAGIASADTVCVSASSAISAATTMSAGSTILSPLSASSCRHVSTWSSSSSESPTSSPWAFRKVKHIPPPTSSLSTLGSSELITASLSLTLLPPSTTTYGRFGSPVSCRSTANSSRTRSPQ